MSFVEPTALITSALAPVVSLSACAILASNAQTQFSSLVDRLRTLNAERMAFHTVEEPNDFQQARIKSLDHQIPVFFHRTRLLRNAIFLLFMGMMFILLTSFIIISIAAFDATWLTIFSKGAFFTGLFFVLMALFALLSEVFLTFRVVKYELNIYE